MDCYRWLLKVTHVRSELPLGAVGGGYVDIARRHYERELQRTLAAALM